jgi:2-methylcitrate dehydratase PrpD
MSTYSEQLASWFFALDLKDLPDDVVDATKLRILDSLGVMLVAADTPIGLAVRDAVAAMGSGSDSRMIGYGDRSMTTGTALVNGTLAHAMDFDDTHLTSLVHPSAPLVATALAVGEMMEATGKEVLISVAAGVEIGCRLGLVAPMAFHRRGFHPTGILTGVAASMVAGRLMGLNRAQLQAAVGINGSQASGIIESYADGTWAKTLHAGWAASSGITAALLARSGFTGPASVLEGQFGLFNAFVPDAPGGLRFEELTNDIGNDWEARRCSPKPYPCAHVIHPFVDLALELRREGLVSGDVGRIELPISEAYFLVVGEPRDAKLRPRTPTHARASLPYCVAAALQLGSLGVDAFSDERIADPDIIELAAKMYPVSDPDPPPLTQLRGRIVAETKSGGRIVKVLEHNRGSPENPMTREEIEQKFIDNARAFLPADKVASVPPIVSDLEALKSVSNLIDFCIA